MRRTQELVLEVQLELKKAGTFTACFLLLLVLLCAPVYPAVLPNSETTASHPSIALNPSKGVAGATIAVSGSAFQPGERVSLLWETVSGRVTVIGGYMFGGHEFENKTRALSQVVANGDGSISTSIVIPYDYGGYHQVEAQGSQGSAATFTFFVMPYLSMSPSSGPAGSKIVFTGDGFGWTVGLDDAWQVDYDNKYLGYFTAIEGKGNVTFSIYATGEVGLHQISVYVNPYGPTYLNLQEAFQEFAQLPRFNFNFELTEGQPREASSEVIWNVAPNVSPGQVRTGAQLTVDPDSGPVGTMLTISGVGFKPGEDLNLTWTSVAGAYISPSGFINTSIPMPPSEADSSGHFETRFRAPYDVGGFHTIQAEGSAGSLASSSFYIIRSAIISPTSGPPGTKITIHIYGVGWKSWENIVAVDYDNGYTGYACALGSQPGNITILLSALGSTGLHTIDLYPSIFRGPLTINYRSLGGTEPDVYRLPLLAPYELPTPVPIFHFEFIITSQSAPAPSGLRIEYVALLIPAAAAAAILLFRGKMRISRNTKAPGSSKSAQTPADRDSTRRRRRDYRSRRLVKKS
jgi:hypothetical protein